MKYNKKRFHVYEFCNIKASEVEVHDLILMSNNKYFYVDDIIGYNLKDENSEEINTYDFGARLCDSLNEITEVPKDALFTVWRMANINADKGLHLNILIDTENGIYKKQDKNLEAALNEKYGHKYNITKIN